MPYGNGTFLNKEQYYHSSMYGEWIDRAIAAIKGESNGLYTPEDILKLENNFLKVLLENLDDVDNLMKFDRNLESDPNYEDALFKAMDSTLDMLKQMHIDKGEVIKDYNFVKRTLQEVI